MSIGRPTVYRSEYCDEIVEHMATGKSLTSFAVKINVHRDSLYEWAKVYPEFSDALEKARGARLSHYEQLGYAGMVGKIKGFNATVWIFSMKAYFGIREDGDEENKKQPINVTFNVVEDGNKSDGTTKPVPDVKK